MQQLDARKLQCPMPILHTKKALTTMESGEKLQILSSDPGSANDMESFCRKSGHVLEEATESQGEFRFIIRKG
ncbi:MAG: sulfurtransferase TusA family protein [Magnetococcales bacterium]|nr:sulfurtransferase TusA family protein [Magnetococcales bacterium]